MCDQRLWQDLWPLLPESINPQHVTIPNAENIDAIVDILATQLPEQPFTLLGFSLGGYVATAFACRFPERIKQLTIVAASPQGLSQQERQQRRAIIDYVEERGYAGIPKSKIDRLLHPAQRGRADLHQLIKAMDANLGAGVLLQQLKNTSKREDLTAALSAQVFKTDFICADRDPLVHAESLQTLSRHNQRINVHCIDECGHMIPLEQPQFLAHLLKKLWANG